MKKILQLLLILVPAFSSGQDISLQKLLSLQKERLITIQDFLDSNSWSLVKTVTVAETDSLFWDFKVTNFLDSMRQIKPQKPLTKRDNFNLNLVKTYTSTAPLYLIYHPTNDKSKKSLKVNDFTIRFPRQSLYQSIALGLDAYWNQSFQQSLEITFEGIDPKDLLEQVALLKIPKDSTYIVYQDPTIKRVYMYKDQTVVITTFDLKKSSNLERTYSIEIYKKSDFIYLNEAELDLRGKTDIIQ